jgi:hypothetical protein
MARRIRSDWKQVVAAYRRSRLTQREFAAQQRISVETLRSWLYKRAPQAAPRLVPVRVTAAPMSDAIELRLPSGAVLRIGVGADVEYVVTLVRALA